MAHLIDKDALVAEIERRKEKCDTFYNIALSNNAEVAKVVIEEQKRQHDSLLSFINTLKVKEVDLEKEIANQYESNYEEYLTYEEFADIAKHFFELRLKAQKGE